MVYWNKSGATRKGVKRGPYGPRGKYAQKPLELRGKTVREPHVMKQFWQTHTMDDMITYTPEEIDIKIDQFLIMLEAKKLKQDPSWWYPETIVKSNFK